MKKLLCFLVLLMIFSMPACGKKDADTGKQPDEEISYYQLGETISSDIFDFTLNDAVLAYYASASHDSTYATPLESSDGGIFAAAKGHSLLLLTVTVKNTDRAGSISFGSDLGGNPGRDSWPLHITAKYNDNMYDVHSFDLSSKDGYYGFNLQFSAESKDGGQSFSVHTSGNALLHAGENRAYRIVGVVPFEPESLNDPFELIFKVYDANGNPSLCSYKIEH